MSKSLLSRFSSFNSIPNVIALSLILSSALILIWIGGIIWKDISFWNKEIGTILFSSRTGEPISLGIGMTVINYVLVGSSLLIAGTVIFLRNRILSAKPEQIIEKQVIMEQNLKPSLHVAEKVPDEVESPVNVETAIAQEERIFSGCLHHFGYLSSRPRDSPIPQECIICQRLGDCMVATIYIKKTQ